MRGLTLLTRSLMFHWRSHLAVGLGVVVATATLVGALLVGDSMRGSLLDNAVNRLGKVDYMLNSQRFVTESLIGSLNADDSFRATFRDAAPAIVISGGASNPESGARSNKITVFGVDDRFWKLARDDSLQSVKMPEGRQVILNQALADQLGAAAGNAVLLRMGKADPVPTETLLGRRDDTKLTLRLQVATIVPAGGLGAFESNPRQSRPYNAWVSLPVLQRALALPDRVNTAFFASAQPPTDKGDDEGMAQDAIANHLALSDLGLIVRLDADRGYLSVESEGMLVEPNAEGATIEAAKELALSAAPVLTYLANEISVDNDSDGRVVPYSTVTAIGSTTLGTKPLTLVDGSPATQLAAGDILLNEWAAGQLQAHVRDPVKLTYYITGDFGELDTVTQSFTLRGVVRLDAAAADPGFTPTYRGVTDAKNLSEWDPPFPMDLSLIRDQDEQYWAVYKATPKAFVSLDEGRRLWTQGHERFGQSTAIRVTPDDSGGSLDVDEFSRALLSKLNPSATGITVDPIRRRIVESSAGSTDFAMLFTSFSFFLIASACMLIALLFGLGVERRAKEIGTLLAVGTPAQQVRRWLLGEGVLVAVVGGAIGLVAAIGYAWLMLAGLRTWWSDAANAPFLTLHAGPMSIAIGHAAAIVVSLVAIRWSIRRTTRLPASTLLSGGMQSTPESPGMTKRSRAGALAGLCAILAVALVILAATEQIPQAPSFFGAGACMLIACLAAVAARTARSRTSTGATGAAASIGRLGVRNALRHRGRSLLTISLIASASFLITALEAFRIAPGSDRPDKHSPSGGFQLYAESAVSLPYDLNTPAGRESLGFSDPTSKLFDRFRAIPMRLRPGDEASCLNLYTPKKHRIAGATPAMIERGGFEFASTIDTDEATSENPWRLLEQQLPDGAIPVIGDANAVQWQLHSGLGKDLSITNERGLEVHLRFVALLSGSALQDELIVAESQFVRLFPSITGHSFFLIEADPNQTSEVAQMLERELERFSFDASSINDRLAGYMAVQNTYLSTFQTLGGLGLVLGTVGLAVVLLRNVWERRGELALMRALGFSHRDLGWLVLSENIGLVLTGLAAGVVSAIVAIAPHIVQRSDQISWSSLVTTILLVVVVGIGGGAIALIPTLRTPLLPALRRE